MECITIYSKVKYFEKNMIKHWGKRVNYSLLIDQEKADFTFSRIMDAMIFIAKWTDERIKEIKY